jgi:hypothetical protein
MVVKVPISDPLVFQRINLKYIRRQPTILLSVLILVPVVVVLLATLYADRNLVYGGISLAWFMWAIVMFLYWLRVPKLQQSHKIALSFDDDAFTFEQDSAKVCVRWDGDLEMVRCGEDILVVQGTHLLAVLAGEMIGDDIKRAVETMAENKGVLREGRGYSREWLDRSEFCLVLLKSAFVFLLIVILLGYSRITAARQFGFTSNPPEGEQSRSAFAPLE